MTLDVEILNVNRDGNELTVDVSVSTESSETIEYDLNINDTGTGGRVTRSGTLVGGAGSFPGDAEIKDVTFGVSGDTTGGTVTAVITSPDRYVGPEYQDQVDWGDAGSGSPGGPPASISNCSPNIANGGDLKMTYSLAPEDDESVEVDVDVRVDGRWVGTATHNVPRRGGQFSQTIPAVNLPAGEEMPVEVGVDGNFSDCGTVSVGGAADGSVAITGASVSASGETVTAEVSLTGTAPAGEVSVSVRSDRAGFAFTETVETGVNLSDTTVEVAGDVSWESGEHTVTVEAAVADGGGEFVAQDRQQAGTVTIGETNQEPSPECGQLIAEYGDVIRRYANDNGRVTLEAARRANEDLQADRIVLGEARAVAEAYRNDCVVEPESGPNLALLGAAGLAVAGIGYAVTRD